MLRRALSFAFIIGFILNPIFAAKKAKYKGGPVENGGSISGVISVAGSGVHDLRKKVTKNSNFCGTSIDAEKYVVSKSGKVQWAIAYLKGIKKGKNLDKNTEITLDNKSCKFVPHVLVAPKGGMLVVKNSDPMLHNSHFYLIRRNKKKNVINLALPIKDQVLKKRKILRKSGLLSVICDIHEFMQAYVMVLEHPYGAVTNEGGAFKFTDVPAGTYKLVVWHEGFGEKTTEVTVKPGKNTEFAWSYDTDKALAEIQAGEVAKIR